MHTTRAGCLALLALLAGCPGGEPGAPPAATAPVGSEAPAPHPSAEAPLPPLDPEGVGVIPDAQSLHAIPLRRWSLPPALQAMFERLGCAVAGEELLQGVRDDPSAVRWIDVQDFSYREYVPAALERLRSRLGVGRLLSVTLEQPHFVHVALRRPDGTQPSPFSVSYQDVPGGEAWSRPEVIRLLEQPLAALLAARVPGSLSLSFMRQAGPPGPPGALVTFPAGWSAALVASDGQRTEGRTSPFEPRSTSGQYRLALAGPAAEALELPLELIDGHRVIAHFQVPER